MSAQPSFAEPDAVGRFGRSVPFRPPWTDEVSVRANCTSCGDCIKSCPEAILITGPANTPVVDFASGACTFCGACADACIEGVFQPTDAEPWSLIAQISGGCLLSTGVECRSCTDFCDTRALRFDLTARPVGRITMDTDTCTGCGACVSACPVAAITITQTHSRRASDEHLRMSDSRSA